MLKAKDEELHILHLKIDSINHMGDASMQLYNELKIQYPDLLGITMSSANIVSSLKKNEPAVLIVLEFARAKPRSEKKKIEGWLKVRLSQSNIDVVFRK